MGISLIPFHRGLIAAAIVFCFGYAAWELAALRSGVEGGISVIAVVFILLGFGLIYYLARLNRFLGFGPGGDGEDR